MQWGLRPDSKLLQEAAVRRTRDRRLIPRHQQVGRHAARLAMHRGGQSLTLAGRHAERDSRHGMLRQGREPELFELIQCPTDRDVDAIQDVDQRRSLDDRQPRPSVQCPRCIQQALPAAVWVLKRRLGGRKRSRRSRHADVAQPLYFVGDLGRVGGNRNRYWSAVCPQSVFSLWDRPPSGFTGHPGLLSSVLTVHSLTSRASGCCQAVAWRRPWRNGITWPDCFTASR